jgi:hypothetical protein
MCHCVPAASGQLMLLMVLPASAVPANQQCPPGDMYQRPELALLRASLIIEPMLTAPTALDPDTVCPWPASACEIVAIAKPSPANVSVVLRKFWSASATTAPSCSPGLPNARAVVIDCSWAVAGINRAAAQQTAAEYAAVKQL